MLAYTLQVLLLSLKYKPDFLLEQLAASHASSLRPQRSLSRLRRRRYFTFARREHVLRILWLGRVNGQLLLLGRSLALVVLGGLALVVVALEAVLGGGLGGAGDFRRALKLGGGALGGVREVGFGGR